MQTNKELYLMYQEYIYSTGYADSTKATYLNHVRHLYSYAEQYNLSLLNFTTLQVIEYKRVLIKFYTQLTINNKLSAVRNFYDYLQQLNIVDKNVVFNSLFFTVDKCRPQYLDLEQRSLLMTYLGTKGEHVQLAFNIMLYSGLRISEVTNILIADIEFREEKAYIHVKDIKTNKLRLCPVFSQEVSQALKEQINKKLTGEKLLDISARTLQHYGYSFAQEHNIKFSVHTCRHIFATDRIRTGVKLEILKTLMGHKSINTTLLYIYIAEEQIYNLI